MAKGIFKAGIAIFIISLSSKIIGFIREVLIAKYYGTSYIADAFYIGLTPSTLAITFAMTISSVFLPIFIKLSSNKKIAFLFANNVLLMFFLVISFIFVFVIIFTDAFIFFLAPGITNETVGLTEKLVMILFPLVFIVIAIQIYTLMLNSFNNFVSAAASIVPNNLIIVVYLLIIGDEFGITGVAVVTLIANILQLIILYMLLKNKDYRISNNVEIWGGNSKGFLLLLIPVLMSTGFNQLNAVFDRIFASNISEGAIASLSYAFRLRGIATGIFITPIITLTFPKLARHTQNENYKEVSDITHNSIITLFLFLIPLTIFFLFFSVELIQLLFERGNFDQRATEMTSSLFFAYSFGILAIGFREISIRTFYSYSDTKTPTYILIFGSIINVFLSYIFVGIYGLMGLGLSASISFLITALITIVLLKKKLPMLWSKTFVVQVIKLGLGGAITAIFIFYFKEMNLINFIYMENGYIKIIYMVLTGIIIYILFFTLLVLLKEKQSIIFTKKILIFIKEGKRK